MQGIIPYGAQILIAAGLTKELGALAVSPVQIIPFLWYQALLAVFAILSIFIRFADPNPKDKWDFENDVPLTETKTSTK